MSTPRLVTIMCVHPTCGRWWERGVAETATLARQQLSGTGWTLGLPDTDGTRGRRDFYPCHSPTDAGHDWKPLPAGERWCTRCNLREPVNDGDPR